MDVILYSMHCCWIEASGHRANALYICTSSIVFIGEELHT
jgi:hypothetical protein